MVSTRTALFYVLAAVLIAALSAGIGLLVGRGTSDNPGVEIVIPTATATPELRVYITGEVKAPGVYVVSGDDRLVDAIEAAGGTTNDARLSCINLALRLTDEAHFHVPGPEEPCQATPSGDASTNRDGIDLNTATVEQLETLPGIGVAKAQAIVDYRESNGPLKSIQEVMQVNGIGPAIYEDIRDLVYVEGGQP